MSDKIFHYYDSFFNCNVCHVCKELGEPLKTCSRCKTVSYCSRKHQKIDWKSHKDICTVISLTNSLWDQLSLAGYENKDQKKKIMFSVWKDKLKRDLNESEMHMWMFPRICEFCSSRQVTTICQSCHNVCYCSEEHQTSHYQQHKKYCCQLKVSLELDIEFWRSELRTEDLAVSDFNDDLTVLPRSLHELMILYDETYSTSDHPNAQIIHKSNFVSPVASILYGLQSGGYLLNRNFSKDDLTVHIVGADLTEMAWLWKIMAELPFHWIRNLKSLDYIVIGPGLGHDGNTEEFTHQLCNSCKLKEVKVRCTFHTQLYHNIVNSIEPPDAVVAFNCGLHENQDQPKLDTWRESIPSLLQHRGVPLILTSYTSNEIIKDLSVVKELVSYVIKTEPHQNPFSSMRPLKNFESQHEPVYYLNGYIAVLAKD
ncbi:putative protein MSS51 homolog, mitochondrial [Leptinotarsa decemlineata]|uniref:putative protein MSS51 homolog, mitochondrial n=1 Tax=Leptinotarsa decemlineata TaxID=7539 RepID=UPI003D30A4FA